MLAQVKLIPDDPLLVQTKLATDPYRVVTTTLSEDISQIVSINESMTALEARDQGFKVDPHIPDDQTVQVETSRSEPKKVFYEHTSLRVRKKKGNHVPLIRSVSKSNRVQDIRAEIASAAENPLKFVRYQPLVEAISEEIGYWFKHNIGKTILTPIVLVFLGIRDDDTLGFATHCRKIFHIKKYTPWEIVVEDDQGEEWTLDCEPEVISAGIVRKFILFLPSNALAYDQDGSRLF